ncbi:MAG TPA: arsenosugar biosynthesis radical SAM (seleno)protein ArsS [Balneolales bacterium]|nr:arsenosugar biosynthesis radical SAM (seleno)protein ArsS [Balneolales bacterium]
MKSLKASGKNLSDPKYQIEILNNHRESIKNLPRFRNKLNEIGLAPFKSTGIEIFQVNVGYMCNQTCKHCHVDAGPDRKEIMTRETMKYCLDALAGSDIEKVDLTGGAPEMNPDFRWFVEEIRKLDKHVMVRSNLTILTVNRNYRELPHFFADHGVEIISSLPYYLQRNTDRQRGEGVFDKSIEALRMLNDEGYGKKDKELILDLVYNPVGAFLPADQNQLEQDYKRELKRRYNIDFNNLYTITNMPISRFLEFLLISGNYEEYMEKLVTSFNPAAAEGVMCRNTISVGWDGFLYDCDFNQMLEIPVEKSSPQHVKNFDEYILNDREIMVDQHCYGCTAGAGSSCGGTIT